MRMTAAGRGLILVLASVAGLSHASAQMGDLPATGSLAGSFACARTSVRLDVQHKGDAAQVAAFTVNGRAPDAKTAAGVRKALTGLTRVTGMSARCGRAGPSLVLLVQGHAGTPVARAANRLEDDDVGLRLIFEGGKLASADPFPLD